MQHYLSKNEKNIVFITIKCQVFDLIVKKWTGNFIIKIKQTRTVKMIVVPVQYGNYLGVTFGFLTILLRF